MKKEKNEIIYKIIIKINKLFYIFFIYLKKR